MKYLKSIRVKYIKKSEILNHYALTKSVNFENTISLQLYYRFNNLFKSKNEIKNSTS